MMKVDGPFQGKRILVIEDEYLVAQVVIDYLEDAGAEVVGPLGRIDDALAYIDEHYSTLDAAVLDVNLHGQKSYPIADALGSKNIIFIFTTGMTVKHWTAVFCISLAVKSHSLNRRLSLPLQKLRNFMGARGI
jgi:CheY-like chemotaxis protein